MSKRSFTITFSILLVIIAGLIWLNMSANVEREREWEPEWDISCEMVNKNIIWQGAGYNGIYAR